MKITKNGLEVCGTQSRNLSHFFNSIRLPFRLIVVSMSLSVVTVPVWAESPGNPVSKPTDGKGVLPSFEQADSNGDHNITKSELKNFPYMLNVFDKVDAGEDGRLEQHEYENLKMETRREGQIR